MLSRPSFPSRATSLLGVVALVPSLASAKEAWSDAYAAWADRHGLTETAPQADADGDGLTNFEEFALGTSCTERTPVDAYQQLRVVNEAGRLRLEFTYQRCLEALANGVRYRVEASPTLDTWEDATLEAPFTAKTQRTTDGQSERVTVQLAYDAADDGQLFVRLNIQGQAVQAVEANWPSVLPLGELDGENGFVILGGREDDILGAAVSNVGDVNGDGFDDVIAGARGAGDDRAGNFAGEAYVVFGSANPPAQMGVETLDGTNGFTITGGRRDDRLGSVSSAGDVNGDGIWDILVGAHLADVPEKNAGSAYVIFGNPDNLPAVIDVNALNGTNGFAIRGASEWDRTGIAVANAGDLNGDGLSDIAVGADLADPDAARSGKAYVLFGNDTGFPAEIDLNTLDGNNGITLLGPELDTFIGRDLANAGDVNADGITDLIVGSGDRRRRSDHFTEQEFYVLFGSLDPFPARIALGQLDGTNGFRIRFTIRANEYAGGVVAGDGDVNGDGIADIAIANEEGGISPQGAGEVYLIFGQADGFPAVLDAATFDGTNGTILRGINNDDNAGSDVDFVGDVNGDGKGDLVIGALRGNGQSSDEDFSDSGEAYLIFGRDTFLAEHFIADLLAGPDAVFLPGDGDDDLGGKAVSRAGDVNGDGAPDFIIGAHRANRDPDNDGNDEDNNTGAAFVVFGRTAGVVDGGDE